jgi:mRNA-degrading endonuclease RelE of RelBE toxin-antitoxin system
MPAKDHERILAVLVGMQENPFPGDIQHLKNQPSAFRRRVGDWRILLDADPSRHLIVVNAIERRTTTSRACAPSAPWR